MPTLTETQKEIHRQLLIIAADTADATRFPGCDHLTVKAAERLLGEVKTMRGIRDACGYNDESMEITP